MERGRSNRAQSAAGAWRAHHALLLAPGALQSAMAARMLRLYPGPLQEAAVEGAYLGHALHRLGSAARPFVYADFVSSLDGRIALDEPAGDSRLPPALRSANDLRLLLELMAQADCLITHGGYLRAIAAGRLDDILQVGVRVGTEDLARWRKASGLPPQPAVAVASASLDFALPQSLAEHRQRVMVATGAGARPDKVAALRARGCEVFVAGQARYVEGRPLTRELGARGFRSLFLLAGPRMLETMLRDRMLARLYLTVAHCVLGGPAFDTLIAGPELGPAGRFTLSALHYDAAQPDGAGQWFAQFEAPRVNGAGEE
jgi:riboflavin biosynthesis pyrimidine reductase